MFYETKFVLNYSNMNKNVSTFILKICRNFEHALKSYILHIEIF